MLYVPSFAIVRLSVFARPNPGISRSRARGRLGMTHECRRRIKIVDCKGVIAKRSVPDSSYSPLHTTDETGLQYHLPARLLACRGARTRHITLWRRGRSREARPSNLVFSMRAFASELAMSQASQGMSGARIRRRPCLPLPQRVSDQARRSPRRLTREKWASSSARTRSFSRARCKPWHPLMHPPAF